MSVLWPPKTFSIDDLNVVAVNRSVRPAINEPPSVDVANDLCCLFQIPRPPSHYLNMFWYRTAAIALFASAFSYTVNAAPDAATDALSQIPPCGVRHTSTEPIYLTDPSRLNVLQRVCP